MKSIRLAVSFTDETIHPMHAFVCESPAVEREVLLEATVSDGTRTLVFYVAGDADAYERILAERTDVDSHTIRRDGDAAFFLYVKTRTRSVDDLLLDAFDREGVVVVPPVEFRGDRTMRLSLVGPADDVQAAITALPEDLGIDVLAVGDTPGESFGPSLTERQRTALTAAWDVGYYEVPRDAGIETVADELDCAVSTASTLLRRAEAALVADALGELR